MGEFFFKAYMDLTTCRSDGPIPWTSIMAYADRLGLDESATEVLNTCIRMMDNAQAEWTHKEAQRRQSQS